MALADAPGADSYRRITGLAYVDVLSTLLLVVTFLMSLFMLAQYFVVSRRRAARTPC